MEEHLLSPRQIKMPSKKDAERDAKDVSSQRRQPEIGRYLLEVDRQTKGAYKTLEAAQSAALAIKTRYPVVQVSIYDSVNNSRILVELSAAGS
jgi:hypothetical protein